MNKTIKRILRVIPGGKKFIQEYKNLLAENHNLKTNLKDDNLCLKDSKITADDYKVFFYK